ncbi:hypothetical protein P3X46_029123 [Hevea brasiliensis]|uniref:Ammonium transporter AmtB-like domain-containing protein n=1 Tax=Hevea brasiliensis TaxID=3981 RepID=A0ABQ9KSM2_HEVBR|nr:hypothetical protein P3X46_029123 [Hevea brasiliensis]
METQSNRHGSSPWILYGSMVMVKKKWAVNSAFMALYAFACCCSCFAKPIAALSQDFLLEKSRVGQVSMADYVFSQTNVYAWMLFVPLCLTFSYTIGAFSIWGGGFLDQYIIDYAGGSVIHLSSGVAGFTASYWGPTLPHDSQHFPPNNIIHILGGAGFLWLELTGFNGGSPFTAGLVASLAIINTALCTATGLLKSSVNVAVQGMITGLVCITPVATMGSNVMGAMSGSVTWYTMMILYGTSAFFHSVDDTLAVSNARSGWPSRRNSVRPPCSFHYCLECSVTSLICILINRIVDLRMQDDDLEIGDDAAHYEKAYAFYSGVMERECQNTSLASEAACLVHETAFPSMCRHGHTVPELEFVMGI